MGRSVTSFRLGLGLAVRSGAPSCDPPTGSGLLSIGAGLFVRGKVLPILEEHLGRKTEAAVLTLAERLDVALAGHRRREQAWVLATDGRLLQVLINLVSNALYALGDRPAAENRLELSVWREGDSACLSLADNGCGMTDAVRERIFEPFFTTKPIGQGTGLGLGICRSIVEQCGGSIEVTSAPGRGSEFVVRLPLAPEADSPAPS